MAEKKHKELEVPLWVLDGTVGVLALFIYNFLLYLTTIFDIRGIIGEIENSIGYFGLNGFIDFGLSASQMLMGMSLIFLLSFFLGIGMGHLVRKQRKYKGKVYL
jgi:hypothetical protein